MLMKLLILFLCSYLSISQVYVAQSVPRREHYVSATEPSLLMLFGETGDTRLHGRVAVNCADKWWPLGRYNSFADKMPWSVFFVMGAK
jgi:hypothetical protein